LVFATTALVPCRPKHQALSLKLREHPCSTPRGRVPAEFTGLARQFRTAVQAEDHRVDQALAVIEPPIRERLRTHPKLRPEAPMGVLRAWAETVPSAFRLGPSRIARVRTEFAINENRITSSWITDRAWGEDASRERGVSICKLTFAVHAGKLTKVWQPIACISMHALARRLERGASRDHSALIDDLAALIAVPDAGERVDTPGGFWLGQVITAARDETGKGCRMRNVRTWISA
jgi:hypothetical protein